MKFSEKELEDWFCDNVQEAMDIVQEQRFIDFKGQHKLLGRQVRCGGGIIDVVVLTRTILDYYITIVELKATKAKRQDYEQLERYVRSARHASYWPDADKTGGYYRSEVDTWKEQWVRGILIATSGQADMWASKDDNGFHLQMGKPRTRSYPDEELNELIQPYIQMNARAWRFENKFTAGMRTAKGIQSGRIDSSAN